MKTHIRSLLTSVCLAGASLLIIISPAQAGFIVTLQQVGPDVVATGSGTIDLTGLTSGGGALQTGANVKPSFGVINTGGTSTVSVDLYTGFTGPTSFGSGTPTFASSGSGNRVGIAAIVDTLVVPSGYISGDPLSDSSTYSITTFSSLGVTPGIYTWTWGTGANQNFTLQIKTVPDTGSTFGLLALGLASLVVASRLRSTRLA